MKARSLFFFFLTMILLQVKAQNSLVWATYYGGAIYDVGNCVATDDSGNIFLGGYTSSTSGIASGGFQNTYGGGTYDAFLVKFDGSGNRLWATYYGSNNNDHAYAIATDHAGNVYLAGGTSSTSGIASGGFQNTYGGGSYDAFLVKLDASGNRLWATYYGGAGWEQATGISTDTAGNVYLTGFTNSSAGIASGGFQNSYGGGNFDSFLVKFDSAGNRIWATYYGGAGDEGYDGNSVCNDHAGNIYLTGWTSSTTGIASGGFQNAPGGAKDAFLAKFDASGNRIWATYYGGTGDEGGISNILFGKNVATDLSGNVYLSGTTASTSGIASNGYQNSYGGGAYDCYLSKFDSNGNRLWATYYGGTGDERGWSVATDASGNVYLTGRTNSASGIASGGFQNTNHGNYDAFLVSFSSAGTRHSATYFGGTNGEWAFSPAIDPSGMVYLPGFTFSTSGIASGGFQNTYGGGTYDAYLAKFTSSICSVTGTDVQTACNSFTWMDGITYTSSNDTATYNIVGGASNGCDSLVTLDLTINNSVTGTDVQTACNSFTWMDGITYTSSNDTATYNIVGGASNGCDSLVTLDLTINKVSDTTTTTTGITITANNMMAGYQWLDCNNGFAVIAGATSQSFTATANGSYAVELTQNGCTDTTACVNITTVGMIEDTFNGQITLYPNPTHGPLRIVSGNEFENAQVTVRNILGQEVYRKNHIAVNRFDLTLDGAPGVYSVEIVDGENRILLKVIKK